MTRPGYNRRPALPCADSVALMSAVKPLALYYACQRAANVQADTAEWALANGAGLEAAATRLTIMRADRLGWVPEALDYDLSYPRRAL